MSAIPIIVCSHVTGEELWRAYMTGGPDLPVPREGEHIRRLPDLQLLRVHRVEYDWARIPYAHNDSRCHEIRVYAAPLGIDGVEPIVALDGDA